MKIAVVSTGRSRCTLIARYLHTLHENLTYEAEFYTDYMRLGNLDMASLTENLLSKENYVVKIMSGNLIEGFDPSVFRLEEYDQIHLVERHDFFQQCCSWSVARTHNLYHLRNDEPKEGMPPSGKKEFDLLRNQQVKLRLEHIKDGAEYVDIYFKIKRYLIDNNLEYTLHTYESAKQFDKKQSILEDNKFNYNDMITNYHLKDQVNELFAECFSYENLTSDLESFNARISDMPGFRSLQNFANRMNKQWNK